jgi:hypothetical protein
MRKASVIPAAVLAVLLAGAPSARAAGDNDGNAAAAESLFQEARKLMDARHYGDACPKFAASQKMAPAIGTLLNLADCYEKNNQLASAWVRFHEAIALAQRLGRANREQTAKERAEKLEPRLIKLSILARSSGMEVKLDGNVIDPAALGTPIPVDAGKHTIEATAKGKKPFSKEIEATEKAKSPSVEIPPLEDEGKEAAKETKEPAKDNKDNKDSTDEPPPKKGWPVQKTIGLVTAGAGVLALGAGAYFGVKTASKWNQAKEFCDGAECSDQIGVDLGKEAKSSGNLATIAVIAGGLLVGGGAVLFFTAGPPKHTSAALPARAPLRVGVGPGSVLLQGTFE